MRDINWIILHCTAGPQTQTVAEIQSYWSKSLGWKNPGYHYIILPNGTVVNLQPIERPSNGVAGHNHDSINISYIGGVVTASNDPINAKGTPIDNRTDAQRTSMETLVRKLHAQFPEAAIVGHRDFSPDKDRDGVIEPSEWIKACPSFSVKRWLDEINFRTEAIKVQLATISRVNIRSGPGVKHSPVGPVIEKGQTVIRIAEADGWMYVTYGSINGWIMGAYLK